jgi:hypothetical protein
VRDRGMRSEVGPLAGDGVEHVVSRKRRNSRESICWKEQLKHQVTRVDRGLKVTARHT